MNLDYRRIFLTLLVILLVVASCAAAIRIQAVQDMVRDGVILPVVYAAWLTGLLLRSVAQPLLWILGLVGLGVLLFYGLSVTWSGPAPRQKPRKFDESQLPSAHGQVRFWSNKVESLRTQGHDSEYAAYEFRRLTRAVEESSEKNGTTAPAAHPPEIEMFFKRTAELDGLAVESPHGWRATLRNPLAALKRRQPTPAQDPLAELCTFLEEQLEIDHDDFD